MDIREYILNQFNEGKVLSYFEKGTVPKVGEIVYGLSPTHQKIEGEVVHVNHSGHIPDVIIKSMEDGKDRLFPIDKVFDDPPIAYSYSQGAGQYPWWDRN